MKIVYLVTRADAVGGATIHVRDLARAMQQRGHSVEVWLGAPASTGFAESVGSAPVVCRLLQEAGIQVRTLPHLQRNIHPWHDFRALLTLRTALAEARPDLVSTHTAKAGLLGRLACRSLGIPALYTPHGWTIGSRLSPLSGRLFTILERLAAPWGAAIVCVCEHEKQLALDKRIAAPTMLRVIHNGMPDIPPELRADPSRQPPRLCMVARFEAPKDHASLLHALAPLKHLAWDLDLVGDGPLLPATRQLAESLGLQGRVHFRGYQQDAAAILAQSQIFVLSSRSEAFPRSILEAMRAGLPAVASSVGGIPEAITHEVSGLLVAPGDVSSLTGALGNLIENVPLRQLFGAQGRHTYAARFQLETMEVATAALYSELLGEQETWQAS